MRKSYFYCLFLAIFLSARLTAATSHYYCTVADAKYFPLLLSLIGSIHEVDYDHLNQIAVFDIGMTEEQRATLEKIEKTHVYDVEKVHPNIFTEYRANNDGKIVPGWYLWKPVILKQASEKFPYFLYVDAGTLILNSPDALFSHIEQNGYFFLNISPHNIEARVTKSVLEKVVAKFPPEKQKHLLREDTPMIDAGLQGISQKIYQRYILPNYKLASDFTLFADDGSAKLGFGAARHDQTLSSIFVHVENLHLNPQGWSNLKVDGREVPFHMHWNPYEINEKTCICRSRSNNLFDGDKTVHIYWKTQE